MFESIVFPYVKTGKLRLLAIIDDERYPDFPGVPTMKESGFPDYNIPLWYALYAPAGVPRAVLETLNREVGAITSAKQFKEMMRQRSFATRTYTLEGLQDATGKQRQIYQTLLSKVDIELE